MPDELALRRAGVKRGGWVCIPPPRGDAPALVGFVVDFNGGEVVLDVPIEGWRWQRARVAISHLQPCAPAWVAPSGGEAA